MWWWTVALATPWERVDDATFAATGGWTHEVELGDLDSDGDLDVILANGGDYSTPGAPEDTRWLRNDGGQFVEVPLPNGRGLHRTAKIRDFSGDGVPDLFLPGAWQTPSVLLVGDGAGALVDASRGLPADLLSVGDAEPGDVDGDGDLDLVLSDSGDGNALFGPGEITRLWTNDGTGRFTDVTDAQMPPMRAGWSWDLELVDLDRDLDLDLVISCKTCTGGFLFVNDGVGLFVDRSSAMPARTNNYEYEALDLTGDAFPDLVTINDGPNLDERILVNDGTGGFVDETATRLPPSENLGADDNIAVMLDMDHDGDVDVFVGSLSGDDRVLVNDGTGIFSVETDVLDGPATRGTLGLAVGDLDDDGRLDVVMAQGEAAEADGWYRGVDVPIDTVPPVVAPLAEATAVSLPFAVRTAVHDRKTPVTPDDVVVTLELVTGSGPASFPMTWAGDVLWQTRIDGLLPGAAGTWQVCATDRAGNRACADTSPFSVAGDPDPTDTGTPPDTGTSPDTDTPPDDAPDDTDGKEDEGCGCGSARASVGVPVLFVVCALRRRRLRARRRENP